MLKIGTDIVAIGRIEASLERFGERFLRRFLPEEEDGPKISPSSLAGYWAAKEAVAKALGCGIGAELGFHDIELYKDAKGAPGFTLSPEASRRFPIRQSSLSISHDGGFAVAVVVIELEAENSGEKVGR
jgi:holo-[acyl-carrier protein] synthase